jgi:hypothetical protein
MSGSNYLRLFDAISALDTYDEQYIKKKFKTEKFVSQLHVTKHYLRQLILKSLRNFHANISKDAALKDIFRNIEILFNKELYEHCEIELKKAAELTVKFEMTTGKIEVGNWKRKLEQTLRPHNYQGFKQMLIAQQIAIDTLKNSTDYWQLAVDLSTTFQENEPQELDHSDLLKNADNALTLEAKVLHYNTVFLRHLQQKREDEAINALYTLVSLLEEHPERMQEDPGMYVSSINNLVSFLVFKKETDEAIRLINKAKAIYDQWSITSENRTLLKQVLRTYNIELEIYRDAKTINDKAGFIASTEEFVITYVQKMPKEYLVSFWFQLASVHFMCKDYSKSLFWINKMMNARFKTDRTDLQVQIRLLNLMVHFEQQNLFVLRYFVDSTRRYVKKVKQVQPYEDVLLKFFIKIGKLPLLEYQEAFTDLKLLLFPIDGDELIPTNVLGFIDYKEWIANKLK